MDIQPLTLAEAGARAESAAAPNAGGYFFGDDLVHEVAESYRAIRPVLSADKIVEAKDTTPWGKREVVYRLTSTNGKADYADQGVASLNTVGLGVQRPSVPYLPYGVRIAWDDSEMEAIMAARAQGIRLPDLYRELTDGALRALDEFANDAIWNGRGPIKGILAAPFAKFSAGLSMVRGTNSTGDAIVQRILDVAETSFNQSNGVLRPNYFAYNLQTWSYIKNAVYDSDSGPATILEVLRSRTDGVEHFPCYELNTPSSLDSKPAVLIGRRDRMSAFVERSAPRFYKIHSNDGDVSFSQIVLAKVSDVALPQPDAFALITNCGNT
jgi:hypothetical protein